ncbi:MAG: TIGR00282 family metallophosphoesterase [Clostridiales bacterium]|nr:TIGR00282 family metallophosphoesterase [Clostridiales bacterium]
MKICFVGDVVAMPGRRVLKQQLPSFIRDKDIDFCIVNAENAVHGLGISPKIATELFDLGVDVITLGNHTFSFRDFIGQANRFKNVVVPSNVSEKWPGSKFTVVEKNGKKLAVFNLLGQVDMGMYVDSPFEKAEEILKEINKSAPDAIVLDFHAEATSEKQAMGYYLDGRVSLVVGTHTHVQTADNKVLPMGTGYITDAGMTGCDESIIGMDIDTSLRRFVDKLPAKYEPAEGEACMCGIICEVDYNLKCNSVSRFCVYE